MWTLPVQDKRRVEGYTHYTTHCAASTDANAVNLGQIFLRSVLHALRSESGNVMLGSLQKADLATVGS
jgi:hypothetical protein